MHMQLTKRVKSGTKLYKKMWYDQKINPLKYNIDQVKQPKTFDINPKVLCSVLFQEQKKICNSDYFLVQKRLKI